MALEYDLLTDPIAHLVETANGDAPRATPLDPSPALIAGGLKQRLNSSAVADATGVADVIFNGPRLGYHWDVERIGVAGDGVVNVYVGSVTDEGWAPEYTPAGAKDVADEFSAIYVPGGQTLTVRFSGAVVGTICKVSLQIRIRKDGA